MLVARNRVAYVLASLLLPMLLAFGCRRQSTQESRAGQVRQTTDVPLPEWAPEDPSPEFLRAARVLRPPPPETQPTSNVGPGLSEALVGRMERVLYPAAYEFFGTLTDEQIERFVSTKEMRVAVKSMTAPQRRPLEAWLDAFVEAMKGGPPEYHDLRVMLYKLGAKDDLSNVDAGFTAQGGHAVHIHFWVRQPDGSDRFVNSYFAQI